MEVVDKLWQSCRCPFQGRHTNCNISNISCLATTSVLQSQMAVSAYFTGEQLLPLASQDMTHSFDNPHNVNE